MTEHSFQSFNTNGISDDHYLCRL